MYYQIEGLCSARSDIDLNKWGFGIKLFPGFKELVSKSEITQDAVYRAVENMGRSWLDGCGFDHNFEYDGEKSKLYRPNQDLRVQWGKWGPEHITVPGNACGLDLDNGITAPKNGRNLSPHNVDSMKQAMLLLIVFTWFAETTYLLSQKT